MFEWLLHRVGYVAYKLNHFVNTSFIQQRSLVILITRIIMYTVHMDAYGTMSVIDVNVSVMLTSNWMW